MKLLKTVFWNGGQRWQSANTVGKSGFWTHVFDFLAVSGMICLSFRDRFDILLEKRLSGVAELIYAMLYGKSQVIQVCQGFLHLYVFLLYFWI